jgi:hypothetical protein
MTAEESKGLLSKALLKQKHMNLEGLDNQKFKMLSKKFLKDIEEVTNELIEEDNENPYL